MAQELVTTGAIAYLTSFIINFLLLSRFLYKLIAFNKRKQLENRLYDGWQWIQVAAASSAFFYVSASASFGIMFLYLIINDTDNNDDDRDDRHILQLCQKLGYLLYGCGECLLLTFLILRLRRTFYSTVYAISDKTIYFLQLCLILLCMAYIIRAFLGILDDLSKISQLVLFLFAINVLIHIIMIGTIAFLFSRNLLILAVSLTELDEDGKIQTRIDNYDYYKNQRHLQTMSSINSRSSNLNLKEKIGSKFSKKLQLKSKANKNNKQHSNSVYLTVNSHNYHHNNNNNNNNHNNNNDDNDKDNDSYKANETRSLSIRSNMSGVSSYSVESVMSDHQSQLIQVGAKQAVLSGVILFLFCIWIVVAVQVTIVSGIDDMDYYTIDNLNNRQDLTWRIILCLMEGLYNTIFVVCVVFSFSFSNREYFFVCDKCHKYCLWKNQQCALKRILKMSQENNINQENVELVDTSAVGWPANK